MRRKRQVMHIKTPLEKWRKDLKFRLQMSRTLNESATTFIWFRTLLHRLSFAPTISVQYLPVYIYTPHHTILSLLNQPKYCLLLYSYTCYKPRGLQAYKESEHTLYISTILRFSKCRELITICNCYGCKSCSRKIT